MSLSHEYGHIPGVPFGTRFKRRDEVMRAGVHAPSQAGIHGDSKPNGGAYSICLSEGYEDNQDMGDRIIYVGSGGQDTGGQQTADQSFDDPRNQSLYTRRGVRVVRGKNSHSHYSPSSGYRYDGLYVVESARMGRGKKGFNMCFFELRRIIEEGDGPLPTRRLINGKTLNRMDRRMKTR